MHFQYQDESKRVVLTLVSTARPHSKGVVKEETTDLLEGVRTACRRDIQTGTELPGSEKKQKVPSKRVFLEDVDISTY